MELGVHAGEWSALLCGSAAPPPRNGAVRQRCPPPRNGTIPLHRAVIDPAKVAQQAVGGPLAPPRPRAVLSSASNRPGSIDTRWGDWRCVFTK
jgi:hypothetical protein